jgi:signal transduction histidine kinase
LQLRRRLALQGAGFALVLLSAFSGSLYWGIAGQRQEDLRAEARQLANSAAAQLPLILHEAREVHNARKFRDDRRVLAAPDRLDQRLQWFDADRRLVSEQGSLALPPGGLSLWQPVYTEPRQGGPEGPRLAGYVRVALSDRVAVADLERLRRGLMLGAIVSTLAALLVGRRMLAAAFAPLQRQVEALERFTADASHELRHPLTALRTLVATAGPAPADPQLLAQIDGQVARLALLLDDLLFLARQEQGVSEGRAPQLDWRRFDVLELLEDLISQYGPQAAGRNLNLDLQAPPGLNECLVVAQPEQLLRLFTNLVLNALRYSPPGGTVQIRLQPGPARLRIEVEDGGPGIPGPDRERVFERFWRGIQPDLAAGGPLLGGQSPWGSSTGLGLAIARAIARSHGGDIQVAAGEPGHCVLAVELPVAFTIS